MEETNELNYDVFEHYTLIKSDNLDVDKLEVLIPLVNKILSEKKQDIVLSLKGVDYLYSMHLTIFVQLYKLLKSFNSKFIIVDLSSAVLNLMQTTQLENLLQIHLTLQAYEEVATQKKKLSKTNQDKTNESSTFSFVLKEQSNVIECKGFMNFGPVIFKLQETIIANPNCIVDFREVGYIETRCLILFSELADSAVFKIRGVSEILEELFEQHHLLEKFKIID